MIRQARRSPRVAMRPAPQRAWFHGPMELDDLTRGLLDGPNYASLATINPDGSPQLTPMWVDRVGDTILFSTLASRVKPRNIEHDPRVAVLLVDPDSPFRYREIRGAASVRPDPDTPGLIDRLSQKYLSQPWRGDEPGSERVIIEVVAQRIVTRW